LILTKKYKNIPYSRNILKNTPLKVYFHYKNYKNILNFQNNYNIILMEKKFTPRPYHEGWPLAIYLTMQLKVRNFSADTSSRINN
jgi:hypothetical protein